MDLQTLKSSVCKGSTCKEGCYTLEESDRSATLRKIVICDLPQEALIIKMDNKVRFNNFLKDQWGFNKHSDFLIVTDDKLVFIEMKSKTEVCQELEEDCQKKFLSDECTINYADTIFQKMLSKNAFFNKRETHYVLFYQSPSVAKTPTAIGEEEPNISPNSFRKIPVSNEGIISFNKTI